MSFVAKLQRAREVLEQQGRLSVRALGRELTLAGDELDELIEELVEVQGVAVREGNVLACAPRAAATALPSHTARAPSQTTSPDPRAYTPKHLADKILQSKSALEGERKQVTVLFADVKGSMELAEQVDPEAFSQIMNRFFQILSDGVERFEGFVDKFTGDGIMALFGAPIAHEDHAQRACYAVLHLKDALRGYADELRRTHGVNFSTRMGLNSGDVIVGTIGRDLRMEYTAQGHTVGLAQRMEQLAEPGTAYMTAHTARLVEGYFALRALGAFTVKGANDPLDVFVLEAPGRLRTRLDLSRARGFSKFVGRSREMERLNAALEQTRAGEGQVVCVVAEAGIGKSRLCSEFTERCRALGVVVYETYCPVHGRTIPLLPILQLLRSLFRIEEPDSDAEARRKIAGTLVLLDPTFHETLPLIFDFLGVLDAHVADGARAATDLDPDARQGQLLEFVRLVVRAQGTQQATLILVDDLHWIDPASDRFVAELVEAVGGTRTFLLLNYRPEYSADWLRRAHVAQLPLTPLGATAIGELLEDLLGTDASLAALPARICERTGGNPFFTEEVVQSLIESDHLQGRRGAYRLVTPVERIDVPDRVQAVLAARIDRLSAREKQVLQVAAVIGRDFDEPLLAAVTLPLASALLPAEGERGSFVHTSEDLAAALRALDSAEMIHATALYPAAEYVFKHPLTHEVALASQLRDTRQRRHGAVAHALATRYADKPDEHAALLAYHFEEAGAALEAARWHRRAAEWIGFNNVEEAVRHWRRIPVLLDGMSDAEAADLVRTAVQQILFVGGQQGIAREEADALLATGRRLAEDSCDPQALPQVLVAYGTARVLGGDAAAGLGVFQEATALAHDLPDQALHWNSRGLAAWALLSLGRLRESLAECEALQSMEQQHGFGGSTFDAVVCHLWVLIELGRLQESARVLARLQADERRQSRELRWVESQLQAHLGQLDRALRTAGELVAFAERSHNANLISVAMTNLGTIQALRAQWPEAVAALERGLHVAREAGTMLNLEAGTLAGLARAYLGQGDMGKALATAREAIAVARARGARHNEAAAHIVHADVLLALGGADRRDEAGDALRQAETLIAETGAQLIAPDLHVSRAALARQLGDTAAAERELREAQRLFTEIGAPLRAAQVARELGS
jgi:class 3 adenylate cyclase/tetratricopeptide (TPR) repeat protein